MKKLVTLIVLTIATIQLYAQVPQKMSYQAVVRNQSNQLVTNHAVGTRISILQGSPGGLLVWSETQTTVSNENGLITLEIGGSPGFDTINWANGPYFLKVETDPSGGSSYSITGTSEIMSVPYALHANIADSIRGGLNETDPVFDTSVAKGITASDTSHWNTAYGWGNHATAGYLTSYTETDSIFGASVAQGISSADTARWNHKQDSLTAGAGIEITNNVISVRTYNIGDFAQGGIVFWLDETKQHGLVCSKQDQSSGIRWSAGSNGNTQAKADGPYAGKKNTTTIIAAQVAIGDDGGTYAARLCNELQITEGGKTYGDWYLPSLGELSLMLQNRALIDSVALANGGGIFYTVFDITCAYWTSTEVTSSTVWIIYFSNSYAFNGRGKSETTPRVRAIRAF